MLKLKNEKRTFIVDVDDVIVFTSSLWYDRIYRDPDTFKPFIDINKILRDYNYEKNFLYCQSREKFYFKDWLLREDLTPEERKMGEEKIMSVYLNDNFYLSNRLLPTSMLFALRNLLTMNTYNVDKLVFVTRSYPENMNSKIEMIRTYFANVMNKIDIVIVDCNEKKSDAVKEYDNVTLVIDDEIHNIQDYLENSKFKDCLYLIPSYGYNHLEDDEYVSKLNNKANENNSLICYYEPKITSDNAVNILKY